MILALLEVINRPQDFAATLRNGEFHVASIADLQARNIKVRGLSTVEVPGNVDQVEEKEAEDAER